MQHLFRICSVAIAALMLTFWSAGSQAGPASVSGTVVEQSTSNALSGVTVVAYDIQRNVVLDEATTDLSGNYSLNNITVDPDPSVQVIIEAAGPDHAPARHGASAAPKCFFGCFDGTAGGEMTLAADETRIDIDFTLEVGGRIAGAITESSGGAAIEEILVQPINDQGNAYSGRFAARSDATGNYLLPLALAAGDWHLRAGPVYGSFFGPATLNYVAEAWNDRPCQNNVCPILDTDTVTVSAGSTTGGIDFALAAGATLTGQVAPDTIQRIVRLYSGAGLMLEQRLLDVGISGFEFNGLFGGSYYLELGPRTGSSGYIRRLHNGLICPFGGCNRARGSALTLSPGSSMDVGSYTLALGGQIEGTIVDAATGNSPTLSGSSTHIYDIIDASGNVQGGGPLQNDAGTLRLNLSSGLPAGDYYVRTWGEWIAQGLGFSHGDSNKLRAEGYMDAVAPDGVCAGSQCDLSTVSPVTVTDGATTSVVIEVSPGSSISGHILDDASSDPIADALVKLFDTSGNQVATTHTANDGSFQFGGFPAGDYYLRTSMSGTLGPGHFGFRHAYFDQLHGKADSCSEFLCDLADGTPITLDGTNDAGPFDFRVETGPVIRGRIIDAVTGLQINNGHVEVHRNSDGRFVGRYRINPLLGQYQTTALAPGSYTLTPYVSPVFTPVVLVSPTTSSTTSQTLQSRSVRDSTRDDALPSVTIEDSDVEADMAVIDSGYDQLFNDDFEGN